MCPPPKPKPADYSHTEPLQPEEKEEHTPQTPEFENRPPNNTSVISLGMEEGRKLEVPLRLWLHGVIPKEVQILALGYDPNAALLETEEQKQEDKNLYGGPEKQPYLYGSLPPFWYI